MKYGQTLTVTIEMKGAMFDHPDGVYDEAGRILERLGIDIADGVRPDILRDATGIRCGTVVVTGQAYDPDTGEDVTA